MSPFSHWLHCTQSPGSTPASKRIVSLMSRKIIPNVFLFRFLGANYLFSHRHRRFFFACYLQFVTMPPKKRRNAPETSQESGKKSKSGDVWKQHGPVLSKKLQPAVFRHDDSTCNSDVVYGFDIDDTVITTKSGAKFAKSL